MIRTYAEIAADKSAVEEGKSYEAFLKARAEAQSKALSALSEAAIASKNAVDEPTPSIEHQRKIEALIFAVSIAMNTGIDCKGRRFFQMFKDFIDKYHGTNSRTVVRVLKTFKFEHALYMLNCILQGAPKSWNFIELKDVYGNRAVRVIEDYIIESIKVFERM